MPYGRPRRRYGLLLLSGISPPTLTVSTATIQTNGSRLVLLMSESAAGNAGFTLTADGVPITLTYLSGTGINRTYTLGTTLTSGQVVRLTYTPGNVVPTTSGHVGLYAFSGMVVTNSSTVTRPVITDAFTDTAGSTVRVNFDQNITGNAGFSFKVNGSGGRTLSLQTQGSNYLLYNISSPVSTGQVLTLDYAPGDIVGNAALAAFTGQAVTNNFVPPPAPVANFTSDVSSGVEPLVVNFTDTSSGSPTSWSWDFGDGTTSTSQNPTKTYSTPGTYTVTLTVISANGYDNEIKTSYITVTAFMASLTGYQLGLDANNAKDGSGNPATTDGTAVFSIADASGHGHTADQASPGNQPVLVNVAGRRAIRFSDSPNKTLDVYSFLNSGYDNSFTMYLVKEFHGISGPKVLVGGNGTTLFVADDRSDATGQTIDWYTQGYGSRYYDYTAANNAVVCLRYDGTTKKCTVQGFSGSGQHTSSDTTLNLNLNSGLCIGNISNSGGFAWSGFFQALHLYMAVHDDTTRDSAIDYLKTKWLNEPAPSNPTFNGSAGCGLYVCDGDSLTVGQGLDPADSYPSVLNGLRGITTTNVAVGGQTLGEMLNDAETTVDVSFQNSYTEAVALAWGGTNDMQFGLSAESTYQRYRDYCMRRRAKGYKVVAFTVLPRSGGSGVAGFETRRQAFNTLVRNNYTGFANALADVAADSNIGPDGSQFGSTYYQSDNTHLTAAGQQIVASIVDSAMDAMT